MAIIDNNSIMKGAQGTFGREVVFPAKERENSDVQAPEALSTKNGYAGS